MLVILLFLASLISSPTFAEFVCPTDDISLNETSQTLPIDIVPTNTLCVFTFQIEPNHYADVSVTTLNSGSTASIRVESSFDTIDSRFSPNSDFSLHAAFPGEEVNITLNTRNEATMLFGYTIVSKPVVFSDSPIVLHVKANNSASINRITNDTNGWLIDSDSSVSLIASGPPSTPPDIFLNRFVYHLTEEGEYALAGSLYTFKDLHKILRSSSVRIFVADIPSDESFAVFIANHPTNLQDCRSYTTAWSYEKDPKIDTVYNFDAGPEGTCFTILNEFEVDFQYGKSTFTTNSPYFMNMKWTGADRPIVIAGAPAAAPIRKVFGEIGGDFSFPQYFYGYARTIMLKSGSLYLYVSTDANKTTNSLDEEAYIGRHGLIMSENYNFEDRLQGFGMFNLQFPDQRIYIFTLNVIDTDAPSNAKIDVSVDLNIDFPQTIFLGSPGNLTKTFTFQAYSITVYLQYGGIPNLGTLMKYSISEYIPPTTIATIPPKTASTASSKSPTTLKSSTTSRSTTTIPSASNSTITTTVVPTDFISSTKSRSVNGSDPTVEATTKGSFGLTGFFTVMALIALL